MLRRVSPTTMSGTTHLFTWENAIPTVPERGSRELLVAVD